MTTYTSFLLSVSHVNVSELLHGHLYLHTSTHVFALAWHIVSLNFLSSEIVDKNSSSKVQHTSMELLPATSAHSDSPFINFLQKPLSKMIKQYSLLNIAFKILMNVSCVHS